MIEIKDNIVKIDSNTTSLVLDTKKPNVEVLYFGNKIREYKGDFLSTEDYTYTCSTCDCALYNSLFSFTGDGNDRESGLLLRTNDGGFIHRFTFDKAEKVELKENELMPRANNKKETLKITYRCLNTPIFFNVYISTFDTCGAFVFSTEIQNKSNETLTVDRLMSLQLDIFSSKEKIFTFDGAWSRERHIKESEVNSGVFYIDSKSGVSSAYHNPFFFIESSLYGYLAFNLIYSGNHKEIIERSERQKTRILTGINDYNFHYELESGQSFCSPEAVVVQTSTKDLMTKEMHAFVSNCIIPSRFQNRERPILVNTWEGAEFNLSKQMLLNTADIASELGIELLVIDDGWFGERYNDATSIGDWYDNVKKTGGLKELKKEIEKKNVKLGLWIEPEMISENSNLYRKHPEFAMIVPNLRPFEKRNQLMLDLANPKVVDYVLNELFTLIDDVRPYYIKWDYNRSITDAYSSTLKNQGEYYHRYIMGSYKMYSEMTKRYPDILFEGCSSGGNRFDLGMLYYVPQIWCSDNTDAFERLLIQEGTLYAYPQSAVGAHVTRESNHLTNVPVSASDRFSIACIGAFGYELDLQTISSEEKNIFKEQVELYKKYRSLLQFGEYHRLGDVFSSRSGGWIVVSKDKREGIAMVVDKGRSINQTLPRYSFIGLDKDKTYKVTMIQQNGNSTLPTFTAGGDVLTQGLVFLGDFTEGENRKYGYGLHTRLIRFEAK